MPNPEEPDPGAGVVAFVRSPRLVDAVEASAGPSSAEELAREPAAAHEHEPPTSTTLQPDDGAGVLVALRGSLHAQLPPPDRTESAGSDAAQLSQLSSLPEALLGHILTFLSLQDAWRLRGVSRALKAAAEAAPYSTLRLALRVPSTFHFDPAHPEPDPRVALLRAVAALVRGGRVRLAEGAAVELECAEADIWGRARAAELARECAALVRLAAAGGARSATVAGCRVVQVAEEICGSEGEPAPALEHLGLRYSPGRHSGYHGQQAGRPLDSALRTRLRGLLARLPALRSLEIAGAPLGRETLAAAAQGAPASPHSPSPSTRGRRWAPSRPRAPRGLEVRVARPYLRGRRRTASSPASPRPRRARRRPAGPRLRTLRLLRPGGREAAWAALQGAQLAPLAALGALEELRFALVVRGAGHADLAPLARLARLRFASLRLCPASAAACGGLAAALSGGGLPALETLHLHLEAGARLRPRPPPPPASYPRAPQARRRTRRPARRCCGRRGARCALAAAAAAALARFGAGARVVEAAEREAAPAGDEQESGGEGSSESEGELEGGGSVGEEWVADDLT
eukprot:tig00000169_g11894.t1